MGRIAVVAILYFLFMFVSGMTLGDQAVGDSDVQLTLEAKLQHVLNKMEEMDAANAMANAKITVLQEENIQAKKETENIKNEMVKMQSRNTATPIGTFYVYLTNTIPTLAGSQTILFDTVSYQSGNDYNAGTGIFIAPIDGTYVFLCDHLQDAG
eukprot:GHVU01063753.1.p1 GENE.GHVU01063753.1~~GHVU01063753.1.p1  ORF type:complete len:154 (-),score=19.14 GHVU01063753.1:279-740(-)